MKIGLFDHVENTDRPLGTIYDERLGFAAAADAAGFYCLHVAEHHASPLNMVRLRLFATEVMPKLEAL